LPSDINIQSSEFCIVTARVEPKMHIIMVIIIIYNVYYCNAIIFWVMLNVVIKELRRRRIKN
jgi:hypothetical protein